MREYKSNIHLYPDLQCICLSEILRANRLQYEKGKSFKNTNALSMTDTIDLTSISSPIPYKKSIPGQTQTIACPVRLPGTSEVFSSAETPVREILNGPTIPTGSYLGCSTI